MRIYTAKDVEDIISRHREDATSGMLLGLAAAAISGAIMGVLILLAVQAIFGG